MTNKSWIEQLINAQVDGSALTTNNVATSVIPPAAIYTFPADYFNRAGQQLRIRFSGRTTGTTTINTGHTVAVMLGSTAILSATFANGASAATNAAFLGTILLTLRTTGTVASFISSGEIRGIDITNVNTTIVGMMAANPPAVGATFDATVAQALDFKVTIFTASISSLTIHQYSVESMP